MLTIPWADPIDEYHALSGEAGAVDSAWARVNSTGINAITLVSGFGGLGKALRINFNSNTGSESLSRGWTPDQKLTMHFALYLEGASGGNPNYGNFLTITDEAGADQFGFKIGTSNRLELWSAGVKRAQSNNPLSTGQAYRICFSADMSAANATVFACSINGPAEAGLTGTFDLEAGSSQLLGGCRIDRMFSGGSGFACPVIQLRDLIPGYGAIQAWGPLEVSLGPPTSDVAVAWTKSGGANNYGNVDEIPFSGDETDYNSSTTLDQQDIFDFADPSHVPEFILALGIMSIARKEDSAARYLKNVVRVGVTDYPSADVALMETYSQVQTFWTTNPATSAAWTPSEYNAAQGGYRYGGP